MAGRAEEFFHWHCHSVYSMRDGLTPVDDLVAASKARGQRCVALTDHGTLSGSWRLYEQATRAGMVPIIGCELYVAQHRGDMALWRERLSEEFREEDQDAPRSAIRKSLSAMNHLVALAVTEEGYRNLLAIHNEAWLSGFYSKPRTTKEFVAAHAGGLVASTACLSGEVPSLVASGNMGAARRALREYQEIFGADNFHVEIHVSEFEGQLRIAMPLALLAEECRAPIVATCDAHYLRREQSVLHGWVRNISKEKAKSDEAAEERATGWEEGTRDFYLKTVDEMERDWRRLLLSRGLPMKVFRRALENVAAVSRRAERYYLEHEPRLPRIEGADAEIERACAVGLADKVAKGIVPRERVAAYLDRLSFELDVIRKMRAVDYMMIFADVASFCAREGIAMGPGRGSAAGSLAAWLLGITGLDPIAHGLLFERFLNVDRMPSMRLDLAT